MDGFANMLTLWRSQSERVFIGDIILHTIQFHRGDSALAVVGVTYYVVAALNFGSTAVGVGGVVSIFLAVLGAVGDGGDATGFIIAVGKLTAVGENFAQQLTVICGIAIACLMLAGGIGLGDKLAVLVIFPLGIELGGCVEGVVRDRSYLASLVVVFVFFDGDALGELSSVYVAFGTDEAAFVVVRQTKVPVMLRSRRNISGHLGKIKINHPFLMHCIVIIATIFFLYFFF